jgi:hypothetical protein
MYGDSSQLLPSFSWLGFEVTDSAVHLANKSKKSMKPSEWRWYKRRNASEPIIGHTKERQPVVP